jgi:hypothetical protein
MSWIKFVRFGRKKIHCRAHPSPGPPYFVLGSARLGPGQSPGSSRAPSLPGIILRPRARPAQALGLGPGPDRSWRIRAARPGPAWARLKQKKPRHCCRGLFGGVTRSLRYRVLTLIVTAAPGALRACILGGGCPRTWGILLEGCEPLLLANERGLRLPLYSDEVLRS